LVLLALLPAASTQNEKEGSNLLNLNGEKDSIRKEK